MRAVIQKVTHAEVDVLNGNTRETTGRISDGLTVLLGVGTEDTEADARNGRRPSFSAAARPEQAERLYQEVADLLRGHGLTVETGRFQTHMQITLCNDGPVTLLLDSNKLF